AALPRWFVRSARCRACWPPGKKQQKKPIKAKKIPTHCSSRENKNAVFSLSLFRVTAWCWHVLHQPVRQCFAKASNTPPSAHGQNRLQRDTCASRAQVSGQGQPRQRSFPWKYEPQ
uniref:Uncharacterized protein n=1 Tax=Dromaius novaehollandiae TaxID=8790 RepID=A0A8C4JX97_DRONO